jgi:hypothetical protein
MPNAFSILIFLIICPHLLFGQMKRDSDYADKVITDIMERYIENDESTIDYTDLQEQLEYYNKHPININNATRIQLERLVFLNESDIQALLSHRATHGDFLSIFELQAVQKLDELKKYYLTFFIRVDGELLDDQTPFMQMFRKGKSEMLLLHENEFQQRTGYDMERKNSNQSYYQGSPFRHVLRYRFSYSNRLYIGFSGEKDKGEPYLNKGLNQFDFNSFHFLYKPSKGLLKTVALGDYQVNFGQGLVFGSGISARKSAFVLSTKRSYQEIRPYRSLNENEFLRGASVMLKYKRLVCIPFLSAKYISTNFRELEDDLQNEESQFSSIQLTGLHRTANEINNRYNVFQTIIGGHVAYVNKENRVGFTIQQTAYDQALNPGNAPYQRFNFRGRNISNAGVDYNFQMKNLNLFGEVGRSHNNAYAVTSGLLYPIDPRLDLVVLYRNFSREYLTTYANPFAENSDARNENGMYTGLSFKFNRKWTLNTYVDIYRSNWLRYLNDAPSQGIDVLNELQYTITRTDQIYFRYRNEIKTKNQSGNTDKVDYTSNQARAQYRLHAQYKLNTRWSGKSRVEYIVFENEMSGVQNGAIIFQDLTFMTENKKSHITARIALFNIDTYDARIYATESDVLYQYAVPLYQNTGTRYYLVWHQRLHKRIDFWIKYSNTTYSNVQSISSGLQEIKGNTLSDLRVQFRLTI